MATVPQIIGASVFEAMKSTRVSSTGMYAFWHMPRNSRNVQMQATLVHPLVCIFMSLIVSMRWCISRRWDIYFQVLFHKWSERIFRIGSQNDEFDCFKYQCGFEQSNDQQCDAYKRPLCDSPNLLQTVFFTPVLLFGPFRKSPPTLSLIFNFVSNVHVA